MKLSIVSDIHLGDPNCALVKAGDNGYQPNAKYKDFKAAVGTENDYLIILGDLFDIAVRDFEDVYKISSYFFDLLKKDNVAKEIIYVPGNHDYSIWHTLEHQVNVIDRMKKKKFPRLFKQSVPGMLDLRSKSTGDAFKLKGITRAGNDHPYGDIYLKNVSQLDNDSAEAGPTFFNISFPNLYLVTDEGSFLLTHGQYFEPYWNLAGEWLPKICENDPDVGQKLEQMDIKESVAVNFPLGQLGSTGFGQAGILTDIVRKLQADATSKDGTLINSYVENLIKNIDVEDGAGWFKRKIIGIAKGYITEFIQKKVTKAVRADHTTIYQDLEDKEPATLNRFVSFFQRSKKELAAFIESENMSKENTELKTLIFGHTHIPLPLNSTNAKTFNVDGKDIRICNTGGWIYETIDNKPHFCGAEVITFDTGKGFGAISVR